MMELNICNVRPNLKRLKVQQFINYPLKTKSDCFTHTHPPPVFAVNVHTFSLSLSLSLALAIAIFPGF